MQIESLPHPDYLKYPKKRTLCFFNTREQAENAVQAIMREGFPAEAINVYEGEHGLAAVDATGEMHSLKEAWARWAQKFLGTGEWDLVSEADKELREGHLLLSVLTPSNDDKEDVADLMLLNGGHSIRYVDPLYNEQLTPPTQNPD